MTFPYILKDCILNPFEEVECSNEILICAEVSIPEPKPDAHQIIEIKHEVQIVDVTRIPFSSPYCTTKGQKLLIRGLLLLCIEYSAELPEQTVHFVHSQIPFDALLIQEREHIILQYPLQVKIDPIWIEKINGRQLECTTSLFFWLKKQATCELLEEKQDNCTPSMHPSDFITKHISINKAVTLPYPHPQIAQILDQKFSAQIVKAEVRSTPLLSPCCKTPIRKTIVKGNVEILIKYESVSPSQEVHAFTFELPLYALAEWVGGPPPYSPICIEISSEHFQVDRLNLTQLFCVLLLRLDIYRQH